MEIGGGIVREVFLSKTLCRIAEQKVCITRKEKNIDMIGEFILGRSSMSRSRECLSSVLSSLGWHHPGSIGDMLLELCVTELEDVTTDTERAKSVPQPVVQESAHPYTGEKMKCKFQLTCLGCFLIRVPLFRVRLFMLRTVYLHKS